MKGMSKCPHCGGGYFKVIEQEPSGSNYKLSFIQCSACNAPFGVTDFYNLGALLKQQEKAVAALSHKVEGIEHMVRQIAYALQR